MNKSALARRFVDVAPIPGKRLVPRLEAMVRLGIGHETWNKGVRAGTIPAVKIGGRVFVKSDDLERVLDDPTLLNTQHAG